MLNHKNVSFVKSGLRIAGFVVLYNAPLLGAVLLIVAELLGIAEEIV